MAQLVVLVVAGIAGLVGYSETAKVEKRFRRGPLGVPAVAWGFAGFVCAALVGALLSAEVVAGALIGFVAYGETAKHARTSGSIPWGVPPPAWGVGCGSLALIGALVESTFVIWLVVGFAGYREAASYETQFGKPALRVPALVWGVGCFFFGLVGGLVASALVWTVVCAFLALVGAYLLLFAERNALLAEKSGRVAEKVTKQSLPAAPRPAAAPAPAPVVPAPRPGGGNELDFLPRKR